MVWKKGRKVAKLSLNRRLSQLERGKAYGLAEAGWDPYRISKELKCCPKTIRELGKKIENQENLEDAPRSGRPSSTSPREKRNIKFISVKDRRLTAKAIALKEAPAFCKNKIKTTTVKKILKEADLNGRVARKKPLLSKKNRQLRFAWAKIHRQVTVEEWKRVIFSDESPFTLFQEGGKIYVRRRVGEEFLDECLFPTVKHGGGKIQVWGCFSWYGAGPLKRIQGIMDGAMYREILKAHMAPYRKKLAEEKKIPEEEIMFQQDNDPKHKSKKVQNYLSNKGLTVLDWVSQSPDMNPIENAWKYLKNRLVEHTPKPSNLDEVFEIIKEEWSKIPLSYFQNLIEGMPRRVQALYDARGHHTKY
jgi:transposase